MLGPERQVVALNVRHTVHLQQPYVLRIAPRDRREHPARVAKLIAMLKEDSGHVGAPMEAANESDHAAKVRAQAILDRTPHDSTAVHWPDAATKAEAFAMANRSPTNCPSCNIQVIDYLRGIVGLHPIRNEVTPSLHRQRLDICRGNEKRGVPRCEHLAWPGLNCGKCGCFIDVKARMKFMKCPLNKWPK